MREMTASDWLGVRIHRGRFSRAVRAFSAPLAFLVAAATDGVMGDDVEMLQPCEVVVFRKSDGVAMIHFKYRLASEAYTHMGDLASRLASTDLDIICRDLGIDLGTVQTW